MSKETAPPPASKLLDGNLRFQKWFQEDRETFAKLVSKQQPLAFYVGCSDSRVVPNFILDAAPGEVFVARNVGGMVPPPHDPLGMSIGAALEFAIESLGVAEVVVCGHDDCGALKAITAGQVELKTNLGYWLKRGADSVKPLGDLKAIPPRRLVEKFIEAQYRNLLEFEVVVRALEEKRIVVHAWVYDGASGRIRARAEDGVFHEIIGGEGARLSTSVAAE
jgi:carbonic anhydrase